MFDLTTGAVQYALRGLGMRSEVRANNVANAGTPHFRGARVDFESSLQRALAQGTRPAAPSVRPDPALPNGAGTTVSLETEMVGMLKDNLMRDAMVNAFNHKANLMRAAITGGR